MENLKTESVADGAEVSNEQVLNPVGDQLRAAREAAGISLEELAGRMKLGIRQLQSLESGDWSGLPGHTFIRGFVRNYARTVGLDPQALMLQLDAEVIRPADVLHVPASVQNPVSYSTTSSTRDRRVVFSGLALLLLAAVVYFLVPGDLQGVHDDLQKFIDSLARKEEVVAPLSAPTTPEPVFPPGSTPQQIMTPQALIQPESANGVEAKPVGEVKAVPNTGGAAVLGFSAEKAAWVEVKDRDGRTIFSQKMAAGTSQQVAGDGPLSLVIGYAPGVKLMWRGQPVDLEPHTRGDVARLVLE